VQTGSPEELHAEPQTPFIGYFIGSPGMNLMDCALTEKGLDFGEFVLGISSGLGKAFLTGVKFQFGIRRSLCR